MELKEAKTLVQKIKNASFSEAVAIMKELERKHNVPQNWWFPKSNPKEMKV